MGKNLQQSILKSLGRYIAIMAIIALGAGLFVGLLATKTDMIATGQLHLDELNMFDLRLISPYGWTQKDLDEIRAMEQIQVAEGVYSLDVIGTIGDGDDNVYQLYAIPQDVNKVYLQGGRMPQSADECLADGFHMSDAILGKKFVISEENTESTKDSFVNHTYTVVGYVSSPLFMDMTRGNTTLGNGSISSFLYIPAESFSMDYYTEIDVTIPGEYPIYSDSYNDALDRAAQDLEPLLQPLVERRSREVLAEAQQAVSDGAFQYKQGTCDLLKGETDAYRELSTAYGKLSSGRFEIVRNEVLIRNGEEELNKGKLLLSQNESLFAKSKQTFAETKAQTYAQLAQANEEISQNYKTIQENLLLVENGIFQIDSGMNQLDSGISQLESGLEQLKLGISISETMLEMLDTTIFVSEQALERAKDSGLFDDESIVKMEQELQALYDRRSQSKVDLENLVDDQTTYTTQLDQLKAQREELVQQKQELEANRQQLLAGKAQLDAASAELEAQRSRADYEFAAAQAELDLAEAKLEAARRELNAQEQEFLNGISVLENSKIELKDGFDQYRKGQIEAVTQLVDGRRQLIKGRTELLDAQFLMDGLEDSQVFILDRNTNVGYLALDNNSDIVAGVSKVFPAFFLLVAALVCITTMTRMVEEERTQIGTLKAMGYSDGAIISKYLIYAGSAAVIGCGMGVILGSVIFPKILWGAYRIILNLRPKLELVFNIPLILAVVLVYTAVVLAVTWNCCARTLKEVPAELIRPKAPTSGKKIFLEYFRFWDKISFLNKVMLRNIFRYHQRLAMMLIGIGGCTALLVTGFGIGDSIKDIVSYQFEEVTMYDVQVQFPEGLTQKERLDFQQLPFLSTSEVIFAHQSGVDIDFNDATKSVYMLSTDAQLDGFLDLHNGKEKLDLPQSGKALLSIGVADALGVKTGETVVIRDSDMRSMELEISGIFDNNVNNYVVVSPETILDNWGKSPQYQMALINAGQGQDVHQLSAQISSNADVLNVMINQDLADQVGSMLGALDMIVVTVVVCAGLLAIIVLYNLTNINISERIREIATIKVLGFNSAESAAYVFKENLLLSAMGCILGLAGGWFLLTFVMSQIRVDIVWLEPRLLPVSLVLSVIITMLMACVVDFFLYFKLEKINMAEALKSVE